jgi:hypothetical protein
MNENNRDKPKRLYFKTYLQMIHNSAGTSMFRNWYVKTSEHGEFDAMKDGENSCAFYVSGLLKIFDKVSSIHGTVESTIKDLEKSGWQKVDTPQPGDILVWEKQKFVDIWQAHIGFYIGDNKAVSTSWTKKIVIEHDQNFGEQNRKIEQVLRFGKWEENSA